MQSLFFDDTLLDGNDIKMINDTKSWLSKCFEMKDMEAASYVLEIKLNEI